MNLTLELSDQNAAALESQARAAKMPTERYVAHLIEQGLERRHRKAVESLEGQLDQMASQVVPGVTAAEMEAALEEALANVRPRRHWRA